MKLSCVIFIFKSSQKKGGEIIHIYIDGRLSRGWWQFRGALAAVVCPGGCWARPSPPGRCSRTTPSRPPAPAPPGCSPPRTPSEPRLAPRGLPVCQSWSEGRKKLTIGFSSFNSHGRKSGRIPLGFRIKIWNGLDITWILGVDYS